jgi:hypothetical protein
LIFRNYLNICFVIIIAFFVAGCTAFSSDDDIDDNGYNNNSNNLSREENNIIKTALLERENKMYSPTADTTYLYWLNNKPILLRNSTKCNIFALNTLFKAGYKTPKINALSKDLFNEDLFQDILPIYKFTDMKEILKGDLVVWKSHVIIFESLITLTNNEIYAIGLWAGTTAKDNGKNVKNNVMHGKYPLKGDFIVRRPQKEIK